MSGVPPLAATPSDPLPQGATTYGRILTSAGGNEVRSATCDQSSASLAVRLYASPAYSLQLPPLAVSRLSINLTTSQVIGGVDGERGRSFVAKRHSLFFTPAGVSTRWHKSSPSRHFNIYFHAPAVLDHGRDGLGYLLQQGGPIFNLALPGASLLIKQLVSEVSEGGPFAIEAVESLGLMILVQLGRGRLNFNGPKLMSPQRMTRLDDFIAANLGERILVADLAAVAGLSAAQFARTFTRYTGRSPHQYVLSRRVEQATAMLRHGRCSLAEVAAACGFSSQQHMTLVLKARLGMTPAAVRGAVSVPRLPDGP